MYMLLASIAALSRLTFLANSTYSLAMRHIPSRLQATAARRIATGLPVWLVAESIGVEPRQVGAMLWEPPFREMVGSWADILAMDPKARLKRLELLAHCVVENALGDGNLRTALFVQREIKRRRDPVVTLAEGFARSAGQERARIERRQAEKQALADRPALPAEPPPAPPSPAEAAVAEAEAARKLPAAQDPADRAMWREAGRLRRHMADEQLLHHAAACPREPEPFLGPPLPVENDPVEDDPPEDGPSPVPADIPAETPAGEMSDEDRQVTDELREMFFDLPKARLDHLLGLPPQGMEHIYAELAREVAVHGRLRPKPRAPPKRR